MTYLQASLMVIGGTIVVGVISYNKWQEYKAKKTVQRAFSSEHDDVLMSPRIDAAVAQDTRLEPSFAGDMVDASVETDFAPQVSASY
jgi:uncharacterized membrane protein YebE (DUF533 family)